LIRIVGGPINGVDHPSLHRRRAAGHREIGVAAEFSQQLKLVVQTAPAAVGPGVIECPVPVNEPEDHLSINLPQQSMLTE
jgi:hypothetical protein